MADGGALGHAAPAGEVHRDRLESFLTDIHAREHTARIRLACTKAGEISHSSSTI